MITGIMLKVDKRGFYLFLILSGFNLLSLIFSQFPKLLLIIIDLILVFAGVGLFTYIYQKKNKIFTMKEFYNITFTTVLTGFVLAILLFIFVSALIPFFGYFSFPFFLIILLAVLAIEFFLLVFFYWIFQKTYYHLKKKK